MALEDITDFLKNRLAERESNNSLRSLTANTSLIDFCSNDYLGFARSPFLKKKITSILNNFPEYYSGSTGSRLISGNSEFLESLEYYIAQYHQAEAGLIFNSGYDANLGLFSAIAERGDTIIADEYIHASIIDGIRLSNANRYTFKHNDLQSLEEKLKLAKGKVFIAVESVYSMDGDEAPLIDIVSLANRFGAALIVDEAHATGIFGPGGRGIANELKIEDQLFARIVTFGKALGVHGAIVLGSESLKSYLINYARSFIYTTASPFHTQVSIKAAYDLLEDEKRSKILKEKISYFDNNTKSLSVKIPSRSPIQSILIEGNDRARSVAETIRSEGFDVRAILHPTVPAGKERLRICLHTFNSDEEILILSDKLKTLI